MKSLFFSVTLLFVGQFFVQSCYYDSEEALYHIVSVDCSQVSASFAVNVIPIINLNCAIVNCHDASAAFGLDLRTYDNIKAKIDRIKQRMLIDKTMPPKPYTSIPQVQLDIVQCWINSGAPNN